MQYEKTRSMIESSSWFKSIASNNSLVQKLISMSRAHFEVELRLLIAQHGRQQTEIDEIKRLCLMNLAT